MDGDENTVCRRLLQHNDLKKETPPSSTRPIVVVSNNKITKRITIRAADDSAASLGVISLLTNLKNSNRTELGRHLNEVYVKSATLNEKVEKPKITTAFHQNKVNATAATLDEKPNIASTLPNQSTCMQDSGLDLHTSSGNTVHVEISASQCIQHNQDSKTTAGEEEAGKSPIILFKWGGTSTKPLHCQICDMAFSDGDLLREHVSKHESSKTQQQKPFPCRLCYKAFQSERSLERHQFVHSGQSVKRCKFCYKIFANKENLDKHMLMHNGQKIHQCSMCEKRFSCRQALETHQRTHVKLKSFNCPYCAKTFSRKDTMLRHQETHYSVKDKQHSCVECGKSFSFLFSLKKHVRSVHGGETDGKECEVCGKFIKNRENIARHMMIHANTRPHKCLVCDRAFVQKQHLIDHMAIHSTTATFICKICCNIFRHKRSLNRHLHKHYYVPSKGVFNCTKCSAQFNCKIKIREHILNSHERILFCSMCRSKCQDENELAAHMLKDHSVVFKDSDLPELANKSTETDKTDLHIDEHPSKQTNNDFNEQEAAQDLLRIQNFQSLSSTDGFKASRSPVNEEEISNEERANIEESETGVEGSGPEPTSLNNIIKSECPDDEVDLNSEQNDVIYIVCEDSQVVDDQHIISELQQHLESPGKVGDFIINRSFDNTKHSDLQTVYIPDASFQSGSQIIHIPQSDSSNIHFPNTLNQSVSRNIHVPETATRSRPQTIYISNTSDQSGSQIIHIPPSNSSNIHFPNTSNQSVSRNINIPETFTQSGSQIVHIPEISNQSVSDIMINNVETEKESSVTLLKQETDRQEDIENSISNHGNTVDNIVNTASLNIASESHVLTDQTHFESDRSALIQTLIDYAEKIQEEEMLVEDSSETRI